MAKKDTEVRPKRPSGAHRALAPVNLTELESVVGGGWLESTQKSVFGEPRAVQQFVGGAAGGLTFGPNARTKKMALYVKGRTPAAKLGFELGAMGNMALGPVGRLMAVLAGNSPSG